MTAVNLEKGRPSRVALFFRQDPCVTSSSAIPFPAGAPGAADGPTSVPTARAPTRPALLIPHLGAAAPDRAHVLAVATHRLAALAPCLTRLARVEFVRVPALVRRAPTLAGDAPLLRRVHRREAAPRAGLAPRAAARSDPLGHSDIACISWIVRIARVTPIPGFMCVLASPTCAVRLTVVAVVVGWHHSHPNASCMTAQHCHQPHVGGALAPVGHAQARDHSTSRTGSRRGSA